MRRPFIDDTAADAALDEVADLACEAEDAVSVEFMDVLDAIIAEGGAEALWDAEMLPVVNGQICVVSRPSRAFAAAIADFRLAAMVAG